MLTFPTPMKNRLLLGCGRGLGLAVLAGWAFFSALRAEVVTIDASKPPAAPDALWFPAGGKSPDGHELSINTRYFTRDGQPFFPVMGEFHYARYPQSEWENEILKMKASGINVVATYIFWIFHEDEKSKFDWSGQRDLRQFVELCAKHGMYVWVRVGPWDHGEARNGGFPDWLVSEVRARRSNDPAYLGYVKEFYDQIGQQLKGLFWKDGGPIIGVQLENEYHPGRGGLEHIQQLFQLAQDAGIVAPFYTITGWDNAVVPTSGFLPVFGGYTEQFWSNSLKELPPNGNFFFTNIRAEDNVMGDLTPKNATYNSKYDNYPFLTAEMGGGMAIAYHRRPLMQADDSTAAALVKLGSGITALGYYMYHGGTNPDGETPATLTSIQETQSQPDGAGYNDMEAKSYDFQAPLGEFGEFHPTFFTMKAMHLFLDDFGAQLAPMAPYFAEQQPANKNDITTARVAARSDGKSAFIFINNYERNYPLADHADFQVALKLPGGTVTVPKTSTTIPNGEYTIWPVNLDVGGVNLRYATAELVCKISDPDTCVFFAWPGTKPEFAFDNVKGDVITGAPNETNQETVILAQAENAFYVTNITPGSGAAIHVTHAGKTTNVLVLTREQALNLYQAKVAGRDRLFLSPAGLFFNGDQVHLSSRNPADLKVGIYPALAAAPAGFTEFGADGVFKEYSTSVAPLSAAVAFKQTQSSGPAPSAKMSRRRVAMEPTDDDFSQAAIWSLHFPADLLSHPHARPFLKITYAGDVARLYAGARFADDNFYKGPAWEVGLWRFTPEELAKGLDLKILPLRSDTPLFLEKSAQPVFDDKGEALKVKDISIVWDYDAVLSAGP